MKCAVCARAKYSLRFADLSMVGAARKVARRPDSAQFQRELADAREERDRVRGYLQTHESECTVLAEVKA